MRFLAYFLCGFTAAAWPGFVIPALAVAGLIWLVEDNEDEWDLDNGCNCDDCLDKDEDYDE